jgi:hypothetical protein
MIYDQTIIVTFKSPLTYTFISERFQIKFKFYGRIGKEYKCEHDLQISLTFYYFIIRFNVPVLLQFNNFLLHIF